MGPPHTLNIFEYLTFKSRNPILKLRHSIESTLVSAAQRSLVRQRENYSVFISSVVCLALARVHLVNVRLVKC